MVKASICFANWSACSDLSPSGVGAFSSDSSIGSGDSNWVIAEGALVELEAVIGVGGCNREAFLEVVGDGMGCGPDVLDVRRGKAGGVIVDV